LLLQISDELRKKSSPIFDEAMPVKNGLFVGIFQPDFLYTAFIYRRSEIGRFWKKMNSKLRSTNRPQIKCLSTWSDFKEIEKN
jgi:hypothetical protein